MPKPINTPPIPQNKFMDRNDFSNIHLNAYMTDTGSVKGPAAFSKPTLQQTLIDSPGIAATMAFNAQNQLVTIRIGSPDLPDGAPTIMLIDPTTLEVLDKQFLPQRPSNTSGKISFAGGYFYLDQGSNVICVTADQKIQIYITQNDKLVLGKPTYDLSGAIATDDTLNSVLPDSVGNYWYISNQGGVGYVQSLTHIVFPGNVRNVPGADPKETITKSFASDGQGRLFLVTDYALYCYQASADGPENIWRIPYERGTTMKPGQNQQGCGTTPTCFDDFDGNQFVAITDNAVHMHVNVYRRDTGLLVAQEEVFVAQGTQNACENSLIAVNHSIIVENNYGNNDIGSTAGTKTTTPGVNRVDFDPDTGESSVVWHNDDIAVPSVVSQLSTGDGMIYTYAKDPNGWYWAALDFDTGEIVMRSDYVKLAAPEEASNNYYAGLTIGPSSAAYLSVFGGLTVWRPGS